jgi:HD-GYP domain-containing protein (c-di-GMP phosphodiesterase class II)
MKTKIGFQRVIYALSDALDLVGVDDYYHGKRVAWMAMNLAHALNIDGADLDSLFHAGLLHDSGVSTTTTHKALIEKMDWAGAQEHCVRGHLLLATSPLLEPLAEVVLHHHTHWNKMEQHRVSPRAAEWANIIFLADRVDSLSAKHLGPSLLLHKKDIQERIGALRDTMFSPRVTDAFLEVSRADAFWLMQQPQHLQSFMGECLRSEVPIELSFEDLKRLASLFSQVVDAKSPFTASHSIGVACLARKLGELAGLDSGTQDKLELAGLFHDLGKLQIPDAILEKPGPLTPEERLFMSRHSFETFQVLHRIPGLEDVATWAAYHHETLDGTGYPYNLKAGELPLAARIVAVADVFQALAQARPYRAPLAPTEILKVLQERARVRHLDAYVVGIVEAHLEVCAVAANAHDVALSAPEAPASPQPAARADP